MSTTSSTGVTAPQGFRAAGTTAGLKASGKPDLALVVNDGPRHDAAVVLTSNRVQAAPVKWTRQALSDGRCDAVVLNSGGANACTGAPGFVDTHTTAEAVAEALGVGAADVAVCSTGLIGERLPMVELLAGVSAAAAALDQITTNVSNLPRPAMAGSWTRRSRRIGSRSRSVVSSKSTRSACAAS